MSENSKIISDILNILSIKSFTGDQEGIRRCQEFLIALATQMGFKTSLRANGRVLLVFPQGLTGRPQIGIVTHIDTVPFEESDWSYSPYGEVTGGKIYGRGIIDDKGPTILAMHALFEVKNCISNSWQLIIGSSEEGTWVDMEDYLAEKPILPEFLVTIDGDGVQNGCRGYADFVLGFPRQTNTNHITKFYIPNGMKNTVPAKAIAEIDGKSLMTLGKEVHSSIPEQGKNALTSIAKCIKLDYPRAYKEYRFLFDFLSKLTPTCNEEVIGIHKKTASSVGTSISATTAYLSNGMITINLNVRIGPEVTKDDIMRAIVFLKVTYKCTILVDKLIMPSFVDSKQKEFVAMCEAYREVIGKNPNINIARGLGYNAALPNCAIFGPRFDILHDDEPDSCHQANECRSIKNLFKFYEILKNFLKKSL